MGSEGKVGNDLPWNDHTCLATEPLSGLGWASLEGSLGDSKVRMVITIIAAISNPAPSLG